MTFWVKLLADVVLLYLLLLITVYTNTSLIETYRNLSTILRTGVVTIVVFYFGTGGSESEVEKTAKKFADPGILGDLYIPSINNTIPQNMLTNAPGSRYLCKI